MQTLVAAIKKAAIRLQRDIDADHISNGFDAAAAKQLGVDRKPYAPSIWRGY